MVWKKEWNGNFGTGMEHGRMPKWNGSEDFKNGIEDNFHTFIPIPYYILFLAFTGKYIRIVITKTMWKRLAANNLPTN